MAMIEVYEKDEMVPLFTGDFAFLPRLGDTISKETGSYFIYYTVVEIWHRQEGATDRFQACVRVTEDD